MISLPALKEVMDYDPDTGIFRWKVKTANTRPGQIAGCIDTSRGYRQIGIGGKTYFAHRLAHLFMTGSWPVAATDHRNGHRDDNRWENLREATWAQNNQNLPKLRTNRNGFPGVQQRRSGRWSAQIRASGRRLNLGTYETANEAYAAYLAAKAQHHTFQPVPRYEAMSL